MALKDRLLLWRFPNPSPADPLTSAVKAIQGLTGERLVAAGVMAAVVDGKGSLLAANRLFQERALRSDQIKSAHFNELVDIGEDHRMRLISEEEAAAPLRAVHIPIDPDGKGAEGTFLLFDERSASPAAEFVQSAGAPRRASDRPGAGRSGWPLPDHERSFSPGRGASKVRACQSIQAIWS